MSDECKHSNEVKRGGVYKRRGRQGFKSSSNKSSRLITTNPEDEVDLRATEADVGLTEYIGTHKGFSAVIKQRYSDFHVNEITPEDKEVNLTSLTCNADELVPVSQQKKSISDYNEILSKDVQAKLMLLCGAENFPEVEIEVTEMSKDERRSIHEAIKSVFGRNLVSNTVDKDGKKVMVIRKPIGRERTDDWPRGKDKFVHFVLYKENMDTMEAAACIAQKLSIPISKICYAGTKDRRAKTCQMACVTRVHPKKLSELNSSIRCVTVGNFSFSSEPLRLGDLKGNRFRIALRNVTVSDDEITEATSSLKETGFINYYGLQRFGSTSVPTYHIGRALLLSNWKEAVDLILKPRKQYIMKPRNQKLYPTLEQRLQTARKIWWEERNAKAALEALGNKNRGIEGQLLQGLKRHNPNDLVNALDSIPINTRLIYLHSYQSYIWNHIASKRLKEFGYKPIVGDLVFVDDSSEIPEEPVVDSESLSIGADFQKEDEKEVDNPVQDDPVISTSVSRKSQPKVKALTEKDLDSAEMADVVLPLPGYDVTYPNNVVASWYEEIMGLDGISSASMKQNVRKYSLRGTYRKLIHRPKNFYWKCVQYNDPTVELIQSDLQKLKGEEIPSAVEDGSYKAVILDFCLPSSSYATMALRELLKCDTSTNHQMSLNDYFGGQIGAKREAVMSEDDGGKAKVPRLQEENKNDCEENAIKEVGDQEEGKSETKEKGNGIGESETDDKGNGIPDEVLDEAMEGEVETKGNEIDNEEKDMEVSEDAKDTDSKEPPSIALEKFHW